jgi:hypothetical protein
VDTGIAHSQAGLDMVFDKLKGRRKVVALLAIGVSEITHLHV